MKSRALAFVSLFSLVAVGCDRLPFLGGGDADSTETDTAVVVVATPGAAAAGPVEAQQTPPAPVESAPKPQQPTPRQRATILSPDLVDEPWTPVNTGAVSPGMSRADVIGVWGEPVAERTAGTWEYLYFRNGCEVTCGTFDVVMFEAGQVVDAIVRGPGHTYTGTSSSPPGREPLPTLPPGATGTTG
jgi:hypothetical protein